ncbi:DUF2933 domain-containing protein [Streptomyces alkaliterrae]|nr:DUF2933 domain-containing protein [Streptomyces alkaliterrae]
MMFWYDDGLSGWGWFAMSLSVILFWAAVVAAVVLLSRALNGPVRRPGGSAPGHPADGSATRARGYGLYAIALAIVLVGALALDVPAGTLVLLAIVLVCPLMMLIMMRGPGPHGGAGSGDEGGRRGQRGGAL